MSDYALIKALLLAEEVTEVERDNSSVSKLIPFLGRVHLFWLCQAPVPHAGIRFLQREKLLGRLIPCQGFLSCSNTEAAKMGITGVLTQPCKGHLVSEPSCNLKGNEKLKKSLCSNCFSSK